MTKWAVPQKSHGPLDEAREALDRVEVRLASIPGSGDDALQVIFLLDRAAERIEKLGAAGTDVRAEQGRLESAWKKLQRQARLFLREVRPALAEARQQRGDAASRPWWSLDLAYARAQRRRLGKGAFVGFVTVLLLVIGWWAYERFLAPPPEVLLALQHVNWGEEQARMGDVEGALEEFAAAAALVPDDPPMLLWVGVLRQETGDEEGAQEAYDAVRDLGLDEPEFLFQRGIIFLQVGNVEAASADAETVIGLAPQWGYGYYLRASVAAETGDISAAADGLRRAAELAHEAEDVELESLARVQLGLLIQYQP